MVAQLGKQRKAVWVGGKQSCFFWSDESVQLRLRFCLSHFNCNKIAVQFGKQKVVWVGDNSHICFGQKLPGEKGSASSERSLRTFSRSRHKASQ
jgi:hypothetical protein